VETFEKRLNRFLNGSPNEVFFTILNSVLNSFLPELRNATEAGLYNLVLLGAHSVMQTIGEQIYGKKGLDATAFYLINFVDGNTEDTQFSIIAKDLHLYRNINAHQWSSRSNHEVGLDTTQEKGWWRDDQGLHINPVIFMRCFSNGFERQGPMLRNFIQCDALRALRRKYCYLYRWLEIDKNSSVSKEMKNLDACMDLASAKQQETIIKKSVLEHFGLNSNDGTSPDRTVKSTQDGA
jgi:hypothetical protein